MPKPNNAALRTKGAPILHAGTKNKEKKQLSLGGRREHEE